MDSVQWLLSRSRGTENLVSSLWLEMLILVALPQVTEAEPQ
ncbi:hypothetical protein [Nostoc sp.]